MSFWRRAISPTVKARLGQLDLEFSDYGLDPFGISREHLGAFYSFLELFYRYYFRVQVFGIQNVPATGPAILVSNHSGGVPADGGMIVASMFFEHDPPRHVHGMVEKFAQNWPVVSPVFSKVGQFPGLPDNAIRILESGRLLMVFPEGAKGLGKLYRDRYHLERFGMGFMRIALQTGAPIIPMAFVGGEEAMPTVFHANRLAKLVGAPYWPVPPYLVPVPMPLACELHIGEPLEFEGTGNERDDVIGEYVAQVRAEVEKLIAGGRRIHGRLDAPRADTSTGSSFRARP